jgi:hypothetical protein
MTPYMVRNMGFKKWVTKRKKWVTKNKVFFPLLTATTTRLPNGYSPIHYKRLTDQDYPFWIISIIASHNTIFLWVIPQFFCESFSVKPGIEPVQLVLKRLVFKPYWLTGSDNWSISALETETSCNLKVCEKI